MNKFPINIVRLDFCKKKKKSLGFTMTTEFLDLRLMRIILVSILRKYSIIINEKNSQETLSKVSNFMYLSFVESHLFIIFSP